MKALGLFVVLLWCTSLPTLSAPTAAGVSQITARGRALFVYDVKAAAATDAVQAIAGKTPPPGQGAYLGTFIGGVWIFDFGTIAPDRSSFTVQFSFGVH